MKKISVLSAICLLWLVAVDRGYAVVPTVVAPNSAETTEGDANNSWPFDRGGFGSQRYQQLYDASQFSSLPSGG
jgi:hypothetical protein